MTEGLLVIDKPPGMTSHDVVDRVRSLFDTTKVGHAGTLDPDATGVLLIGIGRATRFLSYAQAAPKRYRAVAAFGATTTTQDASGDVIEERPITFGRRELERAVADFEGDIEQVPPMVSAVRVAGQRLHKMARMGKEVERKPRPQTIYELRVVEFDGATATLDVRCSAGTYVRTLINDIGEVLGSGAHMKSLVRTEAGGFTLEEAIALDDVAREHVRPLIDTVKGLYAFEVDPDAAKLVRNGRPLNLFGARLPGVDEGDHVAVTNDQTLLGVYTLKGERLMPDRVMGLR
ncbi:MAG: tRNA pseudouridine(55) synthase TruB [Actinobacteria bacterium]|nr:tRNA pseudouridine(55) synthase TruB [Actinomycetota bacterium]